MLHGAPVPATAGPGLRRVLRAERGIGGLGWLGDCEDPHSIRQDNVSYLDNNPETGYLMGKRNLPSEQDMSKDFRAWIDSLPVFERKPNTTVKAYNQGVRRILSFADGVDPETFGPTTFNQGTLIEAVRAIIQSDTVSNATLNQSLSGLQSFYDWCVNNKRDVQSNDLPDIKRLRKIAKLSVPQVDPDYFRPEELRRLYEEAANPDGFIGKKIRQSTRDLAICSFLAVLGLRASELIDAEIHWITREEVGGGMERVSDELMSMSIVALRVMADRLKVDHGGLNKSDLVGDISEAANRRGPDLLRSFTVAELRVMADRLKVDHGGLNKADLLDDIIQAVSNKELWVLISMTVAELRVMADRLKVDHGGLNRADLLDDIIQAITSEELWVLQVVGKGGKKRRLPLSPELLEANERWQAERAELQGVDIPRSGDRLFAPLRKSKGGSKENKFTYHQLWYLLRMIEREAGLRELGAHALRHTAGVQMTLDGIPINRVQGLLGHSSIATTGIYTELAATELLSSVRDSEANKILGEILAPTAGGTGGRK